MRAWELMEEGKYDLEMERYDSAPVHSPQQRTPVIGLRHINKLKKIKAAKARFAELAAMEPRPSQYDPGNEVPEDHWLYRVAKRYWFFGFGAYS